MVTRVALLLALSGCAPPVVHLESGGVWPLDMNSVQGEVDSVTIAPYSGDLDLVATRVAELLAPVGWEVAFGRGRRVVVVGGSPSDLPSVPDHAEGTGPIICGTLRTVSFAFDGDESEVAEVVVHELGHALGLGHHGDCRGVMSYARCDVPKRIISGAIACVGACPCGEIQDTADAFARAPW